MGSFYCLIHFYKRSKESHHVRRIPRNQVCPLPVRQARDQGEVGQTEGHHHQDCWLHPQVLLRVRHPVRQPALRHLRRRLGLLQGFSEVFDAIIQEYHGISATAKHTSDMDVEKIKGNVNAEVPVHSTRVRVGRSIDGFGLSPGITKDQRLGVEALLKNALSKLTGDLAGTYYPLTGMDEKVRQQLVDDHFLFVSGDRNLIAAGMERDWPEGRGIFHNEAKTFLIWINEEDQLRIISMQKGGDVKGVF